MCASAYLGQRSVRECKIERVQASEQGVEECEWVRQCVCVHLRVKVRVCGHLRLCERMCE